MELDYGLIQSPVKPMTLKLLFRSFLIDASIEGALRGGVDNKQATRLVYLFCRGAKHLAGFPILEW